MFLETDMKKVNHSFFVYADNNPVSNVDRNGKAPTNPGSLEAEISKISANPNHKILGLVIDMQGEHWENAFYGETRLLDNQIHLLKVLQKNNAHIVFVESNYGEPPTHQELREIAPEAERIIKPSLNAFSSWQMRVKLKKGNFTHAVVMGTECENCVESTVLGDFEDNLSLLNHQGVQQLQEVLTAPVVLDATETRVQSLPLFIHPQVEERYMELQHELRQDITNQENIQELERIRFTEPFRVNAPGELPIRSHPRLRVMSEL